MYGGSTQGLFTTTKALEAIYGGKAAAANGSRRGNVLHRRPRRHAAGGGGGGGPERPDTASFYAYTKQRVKKKLASVKKFQFFIILLVCLGILFFQV